MRCSLRLLRTTLAHMATVATTTVTIVLMGLTMAMATGPVGTGAVITDTIVVAMMEVTASGIGVTTSCHSNPAGPGHDRPGPLPFGRIARGSAATG